MTGASLCRRTIYDDPFIRNYIEDLLENIRTQVCTSVIGAFTPSLQDKINSRNSECLHSIFGGMQLRVCMAAKAVGEVACMGRARAAPVESTVKGVVTNFWDA